MELVPKTMGRPVARLGAAAQNALDVARFGGLATDEESSPYEVVREHRVYRLRHYYSEASRSGAPLLLVPPLMLAAEVYDVLPRSRAVAILHEHGVDPWVVDFGAPEREEGGLERTLTDHVVGVSDAVDRVQALTESDVHVGGYSQGGMFCHEAAAYRRSKGLGSVITFGSPVDTRLAMPSVVARAVGGAGRVRSRGWPRNRPYIPVSRPGSSRHGSPIGPELSCGRL
jgi:putative long chain acyl-CoA synthase